MSVAESNVRERIERLLARTPPAAALPRIAGWTSFALLIPVVVFAASTTRATTPAKPEAATTAAAPAPSPQVSPGVKLRMAADPDAYYPEIAKHERVQGYAIVEVDLDVLGQLVDARVLQVEPADPRYGFADAALQVARKSGFTNDTRQVASLRFKVLFALTD